MIADRALTTPTNTQHLMELKEFVEKAEAKDIIELGERMLEARHRLVKHASRNHLSSQTIILTAT